MGQVLTTTDLVIFFGSLLAVMAIGLWAGRKEDTSVDYYLAGRRTRWWGVAGSIFGSNISADHIVGMMGIGFTLGFVESHFEITAIAGLLLLCYGFLPVYRKLNVFTLSEYLSKRYNDASRVAYALLMITLIVVVMMVPAFYIGSRSLNILLVDKAHMQEVVASTGSETPQKITIDQTYYVIGILLMAAVTGTYTIVGGLKAVIVTDVIQSIMMLTAAAVVCVLTFSQPEIGGWAGMRALDAAAQNGKELMHLYLPSNHPERPWTGMISGLMILHFYYWGTNQFIVQRALSARSDKEARLGIIIAGFHKLLIPFISIGTGIAAFYLFSRKFPGVKFDGDTAFPMLMREVVAPVGYGLVGIVAAGMLGAILSTVDSMMNSAATLVTFDIYKRYINPQASEKKLIWVGRLWVGIFVVLSAVLTVFIMDPNTEKNFFTYVASHQSKLVAGLVVAFAMGMWWKGATAAGGFAAILSAVVYSYLIPPIYAATLGENPSVAAVFGAELNFFHTVFIAAILSAVTHFIVSMFTHADAEKSKLTWTQLGGHNPAMLRRAVTMIAVTLIFFALLGFAMVKVWITPAMAGGAGATWTWLLFLLAAIGAIRKARAVTAGAGASADAGADAGTAVAADAGAGREPGALALLKEDRFWAGLLAGTAVFMLFYFY